MTEINPFNKAVFAALLKKLGEERRVDPDRTIGELFPIQDQAQLWFSVGRMTQAEKFEALGPDMTRLWLETH